MRQILSKYNYLHDLGQYLIMMKQSFSRPEKVSMYWKEISRQMNDIGVGSLIIVCLISIFIGAVAALQFSYQLDGQLVPRYYIGYIVRDLALIELSPTITCLVLAGKVGSNMAAEIGGMRQKEHIDAMEVMGVNTAAYLITPKLIAGLLVIPLLVTFSAFVAVIGGYLSTVPTEILTDDEYIRGVRSFFVPYNVFMMYVKSFVFAYILTTISCYQGYFVKGGSIELGHASTRAVVFSDIFILLSDYIIAVLLNG
ncbi:MAG: ABC transporter permease [Saprospiraceae bacterium]|nr:ABC transporter permease [Saprospiraceae bacterium]MCB9345126.1 ABC transporter permease [Lewinellaceae bacterium]